MVLRNTRGTCRLCHLGIPFYRFVRAFFGLFADCLIKSKKNLVSFSASNSTGLESWLLAFFFISSRSFWCFFRFIFRGIISVLWPRDLGAIQNLRIVPVGTYKVQSMLQVDKVAWIQECWMLEVKIGLILKNPAGGRRRLRRGRKDRYVLDSLIR